MKEIKINIKLLNLVIRIRDNLETDMINSSGLSHH